MDTILPALSDEPCRYPDLCLSLSNRLIHCLTDIVASASNSSSPTLVLSVGSGSGLLEAHLQARWAAHPEGSNLEVRGVEIRTTPPARPVNRWLPEEYCSTVRGTWELSSDLKSAGALLFVYPREPGLISRYLLAAAEKQDSLLSTVVWLGPQADWQTFEACLRDAPGFGPIQIIQDCGLVEYEMMAVIRRPSIDTLPPPS
ncbi:hypothetical protein M406DRAFT_37994 [Cryphonectria parasitica EP155]|uniref:Uncharacterized protein n=1 Tax=Cryphonectria parasitica (strain ATCC 38755 / EP155) TaxID=660469 RepID=A0A9P4Y3U2_CRYP1|nr:uncharacterized protein M406DRAFT_37994 [Cryphonectria parasitica EP155]KAF3766434.1 hypothetical protein M406DRAFT_37994 [Cryphonectria parasitica EP155]